MIKVLEKQPINRDSIFNSNGADFRKLKASIISWRVMIGSANKTINGYIFIQLVDASDRF